MQEKPVVERLREGIISAIKQEFSIPIFGEKMFSQSKYPCFTVKLMEVVQKQLLGQRKRRDVTFEIRYYPIKHQKTREKFQHIADTLYEALSFVQWEGDGFSPFRMHHVVAAEYLVFTVQYNVYVRLQKEYSPMGRLTYNGKKVVGFESSTNV